ncbi:MAG: pyrroline-5-carboxylate reductase [Clostridia bacterium]|nr:pyrroline-5-carboxylate reductase [Clostridia bacterium]
MKISFIGCGAMGGALAEAALIHGASEGKDVFLFDMDSAKTAAIASKYGCNVCSGELDAAEKSDVVFICVKPQVTGTVAEKIRPEIEKGKAVVSIAAGVTIRSYLDILGEGTKIVRMIPNLPAKAGLGITGAYFYNFGEQDGELREAILNIVSKTGKVVPVRSEKMIDEMIAVTSSSPAYFCMMIETMADFGVKAGFTRSEALMMAEQAMFGTAGYLLESGMHPAKLKDDVCSPGGTTIAAVTALDEAGFRKAILEGMDACRKKSVKTEGYS